MVEIRACRTGPVMLLSVRTAGGTARREHDHVGRSRHETGRQPRPGGNGVLDEGSVVLHSGGDQDKMTTVGAVARPTARVEQVAVGSEACSAVAVGGATPRPGRARAV